MACRICESERLAEIEAGLRAGESCRGLAARFSLPKSSIHRHRTACMVLAEVHQMALERHRGDGLTLPDSRGLIGELLQLKGVIMAHFEAALSVGKPLPIVLVREMRSLQELLLKSVMMLENRATEADDLEPFLKRLETLEGELARVEDRSESPRLLT
jgi:hypothetical protein